MGFQRLDGGDRITQGLIDGLSEVASGGAAGPGIEQVRQTTLVKRPGSRQRTQGPLGALRIPVFDRIDAQAAQARNALEAIEQRVAAC